MGCSNDFWTSRYCQKHFCSIRRRRRRWNKVPLCVDARASFNFLFSSPFTIMSYAGNIFSKTLDALNCNIEFKIKENVKHLITLCSSTSFAFLKRMRNRNSFDASVSSIGWVLKGGSRKSSVFVHQDCTFYLVIITNWISRTPFEMRPEDRITLIKHQQQRRRRIFNWPPTVHHSLLNQFVRAFRFRCSPR